MSMDVDYGIDPTRRCIDIGWNSPKAQEGHNDQTKPRTNIHWKTEKHGHFCNHPQCQPFYISCFRDNERECTNANGHNAGSSPYPLLHWRRKCIVPGNAVECIERSRSQQANPQHVCQALRRIWYIGPAIGVLSCHASPPIKNVSYIAIHPFHLPIKIFTLYRQYYRALDVLRFPPQ